MGLLAAKMQHCGLDVARRQGFRGVVGTQFFIAVIYRYNLIGDAMYAKRVLLRSMGPKKIERTHLTTERKRGGHCFLQHGGIVPVVHGQSVPAHEKCPRARIAPPEGGMIKVGVVLPDMLRREKPESDFRVRILPLLVNDKIIARLVNGPDDISPHHGISIQAEVFLKRTVPEPHQLGESPAKACGLQAGICHVFSGQGMHVGVLQYPSQTGWVAIHYKADGHIRPKKMANAEIGGLSKVRIPRKTCNDHAKGSRHTSPEKLAPPQTLWHQWGMNSSNRPFLSCIIASYNAQNMLPILFGSLKKQNLQHVEIIVQDGGSTDGTLALLDDLRRTVPNINVDSGPDNGIYDAWNKALRRISGNWVLFLGADDRLTGDASLERAVHMLRALPEDVTYLATPVVVTPDAATSISLYADNLLWPALPLERTLPQGMALPHQGLFHRSTLFQGRSFDASFRIAGDYDFLARTHMLGRVEVWDEPLVCMAAGGVSSALDTLWRCEQEQLRISRRYFPRAVPWKLYARFARSLLCAGLARVLGPGAAAGAANALRRLRGRPPLWNCSPKEPR